MATVARAVRLISQATKWSETDLRHRARWLVEDGELPKGKGGYGGAGAAEVTIKDLVTLILSMAVPVAKAAPDHIETFRNLRGEDEIGKIRRLEYALTNQIEFWGDKARVVDAETTVLSLRLFFDEKYPEAEIIWHDKNDPPDVNHSLHFAREGHESEPDRADLVDCKRGVFFGGNIFNLLWDIFEEKPTPKKKARRLRGRAK